MDLGLSGKLALVTGSSAGIGLEIAKSLLKEDVRVIICGRSMEKLSTLKEELGAQFPLEMIHRFIEPKEIGDIVAFMCSQEAAVMNGSAIRAEGGLVRNIS